MIFLHMANFTILDVVKHYVMESQAMLSLDVGFSHTQYYTISKPMLMFC